MRNIITGFAAAATLIAIPALAEPKGGTPTPDASGATAQVATPGKRYCIVQSFTGSRVPKKICKTRDQWMEEENFDPLAPRK